MNTRRVQLGDVELAVAEAGVGGRPLLLLHGFTGAKEDFTEWLEALAELGWHAVTPITEATARARSRRAQRPTPVHPGRRQPCPRRRGWGGTATDCWASMGGFVAQLVAAAAPPPPRSHPHGHRARGGAGPRPRALATAARDRDRERHGRAGRSRGEHRFAPRHGGPSPVLDERPGYAPFEDRKLRSTSPYLYAAVAQELVTCADSLASLAALDPQPPTLVLVGEQDAPFVASATRMAGAMRGSTLAVISDAGHSPQFENPTEWWKAVSSFLETIS